MAEAAALPWLLTRPAQHLAALTAQPASRTRTPRPTDTTPPAPSSWPRLAPPPPPHDPRPPAIFPPPPPPAAHAPRAGAHAHYIRARGRGRRALKGRGRQRACALGGGAGRAPLPRARPAGAPITGQRQGAQSCAHTQRARLEAVLSVGGVERGPGVPQSLQAGMCDRTFTAPTGAGPAPRHFPGSAGPGPALRLSGTRRARTCPARTCPARTCPLTLAGTCAWTLSGRPAPACQKGHCRRPER